MYEKRNTDAGVGAKSGTGNITYFLTFILAEEDWSYGNCTSLILFIKKHLFQLQWLYIYFYENLKIYAWET